MDDEKVTTIALMVEVPDRGKALEKAEAALNKALDYVTNILWDEMEGDESASLFIASNVEMEFCPHANDRSMAN